MIVATDWGSVAEWVSGIGALVAAGVALLVALYGNARAERHAREARRAASRERAGDLMVQLVRAVERDIRAAEETGHPQAVIPSPEGAALCRALWGRRNQFATTWSVYTGEHLDWIRDLRANGQLFPRMRDELQAALDALDHEDRSA